MKRLSLPREKSEYVPTGIYGYPQAERKQKFMELYQPEESDDSINRRRMENLKELRGDYH